MAIEIYDALDDMENLIRDNWSIGYTPIISKSYEQKAVGFIDARRNVILISPKKENIQYWGLYGVEHLSEIDIDIDIRTYQNQAHHNDTVKEVVKIIKDNIRRTGYVDLRVVSSISSNDLYRNMYRHEIRARYRKLDP
jgi:hypothetical protein